MLLSVAFTLASAHINVPAGAIDYPSIKATLEAHRSRLSAAYVVCAPDHQQAFLDSTRTIVEDALINRFLPAWYGTPWDFNGTTRTPGQGVIACGYFITTVLRDAGFLIPRVKWAQLAAEPMILKIAPQAERFRNADVPTVEQWLLTQGDGIYAVGLDNHVGFITVQGATVRFVHSNYYQREIGVMADPLKGNNPFAHSRYRVIGKLLDDAMMIKWLQGTSW
jgi:hypothetical protein